MRLTLTFKAGRSKRGRVSGRVSVRVGRILCGEENFGSSWVELAADGCRWLPMAARPRDQRVRERGVPPQQGAGAVTPIQTAWREWGLKTPMREFEVQNPRLLMGKEALVI